MPEEPAPAAGLVTGTGLPSPRQSWQEDTAALVDLTGPALTAEALASEEARHRALLAAIRTPIVSTALDGRITGFNGAAVALFGSPARLYGRPIREVLPS